jgi:uncharacterized protein (DUF1778 family)
MNWFLGRKSNAPHLSRRSPDTSRSSKTPGKRASVWNTVALAPLSGVAPRLKIKLEMCASAAHINPVPVLTKERRGERLVACVSGSDKRLFQQRAASLEGRSVATFVITHAREMARRIVADQETIELDAIQSRRFVKALLNPTPSAPNRLKKAAAAYRQRVAA